MFLPDMRAKSPKAAFFAAAFFVVSFSSVAVAQGEIEVPAGKSFTTKMNVYNPNNCEAGPYPQVEFKQPENGTFTSKKGRSVEPKGAACAGKNMPGVMITYTPKKGFRGRDCGSVALNFPAYVSGGSMTSRIFPVCFNVK
jgi:hypothetical protein